MKNYLTNTKPSTNIAQENTKNNTGKQKNGIILIDKPAGLSSFKCVEVIRRQLNVKKVGHAGTLDPFATGLLILLAGKTTKLQQEFMLLDKEYQATIVFGSETDTLDPTGKVIRTSETKVREEDVKKAIAQHFIGKLQQVPPNYSAVKIAGKRAYSLSRKGEKIELSAKTVHVRNFELLSFNEELQTANIKLTVSSGTYVRSIARDLGNVLKNAAHVTALIRTSIGNFKLADAAKLQYSVKHITPNTNFETDEYASTSASLNGAKSEEQPAIKNKNTPNENNHQFINFKETKQNPTPIKLLSITQCLPCSVSIINEGSKKKLWAAKQVGNFNIFLPLFNNNPYLVLSSKQENLNSNNNSFSGTTEVAVLRNIEQKCHLIYYNGEALA